MSDADLRMALRQSNAKSNSIYEQLTNYISRVEQQVLAMWTLRELGRYYFTDKKGLLDDSTNIRDNVMSVGFYFKPANFKLTDIDVAQSVDRSELIIRISFQCGKESDSKILHTEKYEGGKYYTLASAVKDIFSVIQDEVWDMCEGGQASRN
ncbi:hypothetical protein FWG95_01225 [Candidatus Saccharibacteria bacterium]|nr:hypothetical protein [Candidatus Saccharibacteria bacterium]